MSAAASITAALGGVFLLFLALGLVILGGNSDSHGWYSNSVNLQKATARRTAADAGDDPPERKGAYDASGKEEWRFSDWRQPGGNGDSSLDGKMAMAMAIGSKDREKNDNDLEVTEVRYRDAEDMQEAKPVSKFVIHVIITILNLCMSLPFAFFYKSYVVDKIPPLEQRPVSIDQDFQQDIFACFFGHTDLCLHAWCCCSCRAAHTWHVAGVIEYWPALFALFVSNLTGAACCWQMFIFTYFRMKIKDKLGIRRDCPTDCLYSTFCCFCAVAQEAMAVDAELGTQVACCCDLQSPPAIGAVDRFERGAVLQLRNPQANDNSNNDDDNNPQTALQGMERGENSGNRMENNPNLQPGE